MSKELIFLKGYCKGKGFTQCLKAIEVAKKYHAGQYRKSGEPYITHPIRVASALLSLGIEDDEILAIAVLHDVVEDGKITYKEFIELKFSGSINYSVHVLSKNKLDIDSSIKEKEEITRAYYEGISNDEKATVVKVGDRCHNLSTMINSFSKEKMEEYREETLTYVLPLIKNARNRDDMYSDQLCYMKYHIESILPLVQYICEDK